MLADLTIKNFLAETADSERFLEGGSISALNGAVATSLTEMVAKLTIGKSDYGAVEGQMKTIAIEASLIRERLLHDMDRNSEAQTRLVEASILSADTETRAAERTAAIKEATKEVIQASMQVAEEVASVMETIIYVAKKGDREALADACIAMMTARTCVLGALLKVRINLRSQEDETFVNRMKGKADFLESETTRIETKLLTWVRTVLQ